MILTAHVEGRMRATASRRSLPTRAGSEDAAEEIAEVGAFRCTGIFEPCIPIRRRPKFLSGFPVLAELVIRGTFFRIAERFVGFTDFLELRLGAVFLIDVGMELARELTISLLDVVLRRVALDAEDLVVVLEFHWLSHHRIR